MTLPIHPWTADAWRQLMAMRANLPQALLIHGPRGVGKFELGRRFAQAMLCESTGTALPCGSCEACGWFIAGQHPDYRQIEPEYLAAPPEYLDEPPAASKTSKPSREIKVDQVRELAGFVNIGSHRGRRRLALFHPADDLNPNAANGLLKTLEEPAADVCLILISSNPSRLIPTLRSRCIKVPVALPSTEQGMEWLERTKVADAARWLAFAGGAPLLASEYAASEQGGEIAKLSTLLQTGSRDALLAWPAADRDDIELLAEVLQKWAYDQVLGRIRGNGRFFGQAVQAGPPADDHARAWLRFAREAGRLRVLARHPLNPKLFSADLIMRLP